MKPGKIILTKEGLARFKAELDNILTIKAPEAKREFEEVCIVWSGGDFPYEDTKNKYDFYKKRIASLRQIINNAVWNSDKGYYESQE